MRSEFVQMKGDQHTAVTVVGALNVDVLKRDKVGFLQPLLEGWTTYEPRISSVMGAAFIISRPMYVAKWVLVRSYSGRRMHTNNPTVLAIHSLAVIKKIMKDREHIFPLPRSTRCASLAPASLEVCDKAFLALHSLTMPIVLSPLTPSVVPFACFISGIDWLCHFFFVLRNRRFFNVIPTAS